MSKIIGIDLGTTNSAMAYMVAGKPEIIVNAEGDRTTPSVVAVNKKGDRLVGKTAQRQAVTNPENTVTGVKRFIGRKFKDKEVQDDIKIASFRIVDNKGNAGVELDGKINSPEEISAIEESVTLIRKAAQPAKGSNLPELWLDSTQEHWSAYCQWLAAALTAYMSDDMLAVASICACSRDIVVVQITQQKKHLEQQSAHIHRQAVPPLSSLHNDFLKKLEKSLGGNIYLQRCAIIFTEQEIYILKPRQRRFWLTGAAYADADRIMGHLLQAADAERGSR